MHKIVSRDPILALATLLTACGGKVSMPDGTPLPPADLALSASYAVIDATQPRANFGTAVWSTGDVTGDGRPDVAVGAPSALFDNGAVYVFAGPIPAGHLTELDAYATVVGLVPLQTAGVPQTGLADLNGDGIGDLVIGSSGVGLPVPAGRVEIFFGPLQRGLQLAESADVILRGTSGDGYGDYGVVVADFDGDGQDDLVIGAEGRNGAAGAVDFYFGPLRAGATPQLSLVGTEDGSTFGRHLTAADLDGDGTMDLIVTAESSNLGGTFSGADYVFYGSSLRAARSEPNHSVDDQHADAVLVGGVNELASTTAVADLDRDGHRDILVGAPDYFLDRRGRVYVLFGGAQRFSGRYPLSERAVTLLGEAPGDLNGWFVARAGDLDGDGADDALASAVCQGATASCNPDATLGPLLRPFGPGASYILHSGCVPTTGVHSIRDVAQKLGGSQRQESAGYTMAEGADVTGDAAPDVLVGAYCASDENLCNGRVYVVSGSQLR